MKELEEAADERLTPAEIAIFLTREWTRNNGELLKAEIASAIEKNSVVHSSRE